jgi:hypothetical protein
VQKRHVVRGPWPPSGKAARGKIYGTLPSPSSARLQQYPTRGFARGACGGDFTIRTPALAKMAANPAVNPVSRYRLRNRNGRALTDFGTEHASPYLVSAPAPHPGLTT